ncbi:MAG TPA: tetratricopeptide repeat protein [Polyangiaceae bacterium]
MLAPSLAYADPPKAPAPSTAAPGTDKAALHDPPSATSAEAHQHAARARELYQQGAYRESISELETALKLDPNGKDLVFNLGVVHEKLGDIEDALRYFERYEQMDLDAAERAKADAYVKRLQGARHEVTKPENPPPPPPLPPPPPPPERPSYGRVDAATIVTGSLGLVAIGVGAGFGFKALADHPKSGAVTGANYTYSQLQDSVTKAHGEAVVSDAFFIGGAAALTAAAILFFARTRVSKPTASGSAGSAALPVVISGTPLRGGGALLLGARF